MAGRTILQVCAASIAFAGFATAHGGGAHQKPLEVPENADWATRHMIEEHHISVFDGLSFFTLHDTNSDGVLSPSEVGIFYGLKDVTAKDIPDTKKTEVVKTVMGLVDANRDGEISQDEWVKWWDGGGRLPDFGTGPGHHGDDEWEYEIHHWEKYHDENTKEEDLIHPEDIEHFKHHDEMEDEAERQQVMDMMPIVEANIPQKFRRS